MSSHLRSWIVLLAFGACICSASARVFGDARAPAHQPAVTTGVVYGYKDDGLALMLDVYRSARSNGAGVIAIVSGLWQSSVELWCRGASANLSATGSVDEPCSFKRPSLPSPA